MRASLLPVATALAAFFFASALGKPLNLKIVNKCNDPLKISIDPGIPLPKKGKNPATTISEFTVPTGDPTKANILSIPVGWKGAIWPKLTDTEVTIATKKQKIGNTRLVLDNPLGVGGVSYYLDVDYGFSYSVNITPTSKEALDVGEKICEPIHFQTFKCPDDEPIPDSGTSVDLSLNADKKQCMSPCAQIHKAALDGSTAPDDGLVKDFCCPDIEKDCKAKDSQYLKLLRESGSRLNSKDYDRDSIESYCKGTDFTVTIACTKELTATRFFHPTDGRMLFYEFYYNKIA